MKNHWENKNVLITGATGFLGGYLTNRLIEKGANVIALFRDHIKNIKFNKNVNWIKGDLTDRYLLERILGEYEIDTVFHLAAQAIVGIANKNPISTFESNILGTWNVLEACRRSPLVKNIIVASSDKAYGEQDLPYKEEMALMGKHPYDVSKSCADLISMSYYHTYKLPVCITRCGNLYGGGDMNFNRIIPQTIESILNQNSPIIRSDGTFVRDYFYVEDAVEAYLLLGEKMSELKLYGEAFNFGSEGYLSVIELVKLILKLMDSHLEPIVLNEGNHEIKNQYLSIEKSKKILKWKPHFTLEEGIKKTIDWYRKYAQGEVKYG
ncbi:GDP-mannose 4,6-dehydratase [Anaerophilus nitritogenes]|uniref:GDP-mannose 4,6-dehydratase n=1 Tax=Anaerophilus nitritogenes TaxID=2498136 RepID=UPI00101DA5A5|nr:GDP-mannose 4,6-dehydratase [Anaerophilus nitritogenes]